MNAKEIEELLPWVVQRTSDNPENPLRGFLSVMAGLLTPVEQEYERIHTYLNPYTTPEAFLPYLAQMMNLSRYLTDDPPYLMTGFTQLRTLIALSVRLMQQRGTVYAIRRFLETATGIDGFRVEETSQPFHMRVYIPADAVKYRDLIRLIIEGEKPAYITYEMPEEQPKDDQPEDRGASGSD